MIFKGKDIFYLMLLVIIDLMAFLIYRTCFVGMLTSTEFKYLLSTLIFGNVVLLIAFLQSNTEKEEVMYDPWDL